MKAIVLREAGGPEALRVETVDDPVPGAGEVIVRVRAAALNYRDLFITMGQYRSVLVIGPSSRTRVRGSNRDAAVASAVPSCRGAALACPVPFGDIPVSWRYCSVRWIGSAAAGPGSDSNLGVLLSSRMAGCAATIRRSDVDAWINVKREFEDGLAELMRMRGLYQARSASVFSFRPGW